MALIKDFYLLFSNEFIITKTASLEGAVRMPLPFVATEFCFDEYGTKKFVVFKRDDGGLVMTVDFENYQEIKTNISNIYSMCIVNHTQLLLTSGSGYQYGSDQCFELIDLLSLQSWMVPIKPYIFKDNTPLPISYGTRASLSSLSNGYAAMWFISDRKMYYLLFMGLLCGVRMNLDLTWGQQGQLFPDYEVAYIVVNENGDKYAGPNTLFTEYGHKWQNQSWYTTFRNFCQYNDIFYAWDSQTSSIYTAPIGGVFAPSGLTIINTPQAYEQLHCNGLQIIRTPGIGSTSQINENNMLVARL